MAQRVVVWLGVEDETTHSALECLRKLGKQFDVDWERYLQIHGHLRHGTLQSLLPLTKQEIDLVLAILQRPWFGRLWIRAEIRLAEKNTANVVCGSKHIALKELGAAILCIDPRRKTKYEDEKRTAEWSKQIVFTINLFKDNAQSTMEQIIHFARTADSSDPRDKIYFAIPLLQKYHPEFNVEADYTQTVQAAYTRATILGLCTHAQHSTVLRDGNSSRFDTKLGALLAFE